LRRIVVCIGGLCNSLGSLYTRGYFPILFPFNISNNVFINIENIKLRISVGVNFCYYIFYRFVKIGNSNCSAGRLDFFAIPVYNIDKLVKTFLMFIIN